MHIALLSEKVNENVHTCTETLETRKNGETDAVSKSQPKPLRLEKKSI